MTYAATLLLGLALGAIAGCSVGHRRGYRAGYAVGRVHGRIDAVTAHIHDLQRLDGHLRGVLEAN
jgi:hypothetical protein